MIYKFPIIEHIDDVLPALDTTNFNKMVKDGYTVILYNFISPETFPDISDENSKIKREFRGIIFDSKTGKIVRRPFHKFFNLNEKDETQFSNLNISSPHHILEKLDGSMIVPFKIDNKLLWGTKAGITDVSNQLLPFIENHKKYIDFSEDMISNGYSPIYEWCSQKNRVVIDYPEEQLTLTALRDMKTGEYKSYSQLHYLSTDYNIPLVKHIPSTLSESFIEEVKNAKDIEGYVIKFENGHKLKIKTEEYVLLHRTLTGISRERDVIKLILQNQTDDIKPLLSEVNRRLFEDYEKDVHHALEFHLKELYNVVERYKHLTNNDKKHFSEVFSNQVTDFEKSLIFKCMDDNNTKENIKEYVMKYFLKYVESSTSTLYNLKIRGVFNTLPKWNLILYLDDA